MTLKEIIASNTAYLLLRRNWSRAELGRKAHLSPKSITNLLNPNSPFMPTMETAEGIAKAFGIPVWLLCLPLENKELLESRELPKMLEGYTSLSAESREQVRRIIDLEARYKPDA
jgi:transcriptional regulator with XRE-family HTH domain